MDRDDFARDVAGAYDPLGQGMRLLRDHVRQERTGLLITGKFG